jgi:hypothetical protein
MSLKIYLTINFVIGLIFGLAFLLIPGPFASGYGLTLTPAAAVFARGVGAAILSVAVINWYARGEKYSKLMAGVLVGNIVIHLLTGVSDFSAYLAGTVSSSVFGSLIMHAVLALGFVYYLLKNEHTRQ